MKKVIVILLHLSYWVMYIGVLCFLVLCLQNMNPKHDKLMRIEILFATLTLIPATLGFYSFYNLLFIRFLTQKKILLLGVFGILTAYASGIISGMIMEILAIFNIGHTLFGDGFTSAMEITSVLSFVALLNGVMGLLLKGFITWYDDIKIKADLSKKNFETEMALIKMQLNPHFLFNTLHNIDILIEKDAAKASLYLNKLSDIMRFMLYETKTEQISLQKEWAYLEKYLELQKIRTANPNFIRYILEGDIDNLLIAPMILIPFVENAFKYTEGVKTDNAIFIKLRIENKVIYFQCENKYLLTTRFDEASSGLGNELIHKRLALLYPNKHTLSINHKSDMYCVNLQIK
jgi:two-component system, LytTR family, sensor kinase